jgi:hypothetical protein
VQQPVAHQARIRNAKAANQAAFGELAMFNNRSA